MSGKKKKKPDGPFASLQNLKDDLEKREKETTSAGKKAPAISAPAPRPPPETPEDEAMTMHRLFAGVEPLDRSRGRLPKQHLDSPTRPASAAALVKQARDAGERDAEAVHDHLRTLVEGTARFEVEDDGVHVEGRRVDLPFDALRRLRRGSMPIDARLDLHGMTVPQARAQLEAFLRATRSRGERCVLVIHGKGEHSPQGSGVLRGEISTWLSQSATGEHVAAFATARGTDGGEGAVYVLLRR
jgi:DNA-nicking Smr family endonuclease